MEKQAPYLNQYTDTLISLNNSGIDYTSVTNEQLKRLQQLRKKAIQQSGLNSSELTLISLCRQSDTFRKVNSYAHNLFDRLNTRTCP